MSGYSHGKVEVTGGSLSTFEGMANATITRPSFTTAVSGQVWAANSARKPSYLVNNTNSIFFVAFGTAAVNNQGLRLTPGATMKINTTQQVNAIQTSGGTLSLDAYENA